MFARSVLDDGNSLPDPASRLEEPQQDDRISSSKKATNFSLATANVPAYQAKLLEMAQANIQFAFEFAQRLVTIRSPVEFPSVIAEFTNKRIALFRKYSKEWLFGHLDVRRATEALFIAGAATTPTPRPHDSTSLWASSSHNGAVKSSTDLDRSCA